MYSIGTIVTIINDFRKKYTIYLFYVSTFAPNSYIKFIVLFVLRLTFTIICRKVSISSFSYQSFQFFPFSFSFPFPFLQDVPSLQEGSVSKLVSKFSFNLTTFILPLHMSQWIYLISDLLRHLPSDCFLLSVLAIFVQWKCWFVICCCQTKI